MSDATAAGFGISDAPAKNEQPVAPPAPAGAAQVFGVRLAVAERFTALLADTGVSHGLIGPREVPRLWDRHVLNCAVIHPAIATGQMVIDVGSGAGLPGLALAIARPDLDLHLVEPMLRRTNWLSRAVDELELANVTVHRGRAEQFWGILSAPVVTARAVAQLSELAGWCLPLVLPGGSLLALKGARAAEELEANRALLHRLGAVTEALESFGRGVVDPETTVLRVVLGDCPARATRGKNLKAKGTRRG
ncbi:MAG: 16S rRNA (guanine(527)-N(7))-methyltransferase RsmG [Dermatophilaceae bacterium]